MYDVLQSYFIRLCQPKVIISEHTLPAQELMRKPKTQALVKCASENRTWAPGNRWSTQVAYTITKQYIPPGHHLGEHHRCGRAANTKDVLSKLQSLTSCKGPSHWSPALVHYCNESCSPSETGEIFQEGPEATKQGPK